MSSHPRTKVLLKDESRRFFHRVNFAAFSLPRCMAVLASNITNLHAVETQSNNISRRKQRVDRVHLHAYLALCPTQPQLDLGHIPVDGEIRTSRERHISTAFVSLRDDRSNARRYVPTLLTSYTAASYNCRASPDILGPGRVKKIRSLILKRKKNS